MEANIGTWDRIVRITLGCVLVWLAFTRPEYGWGWLGVFPLVSGLLRHCPIYARLKITTCRSLRS